MSIDLRDLPKVEKFRQKEGEAMSVTLHFADGSVSIGDVVRSDNGCVEEISGNGVLRRRTEAGE